MLGQKIILDCNDYDTTDKQIPYDFLYEIIESRIDEIVYLVHEYLIANVPVDDFEKIFLTGGCGAMPNFSDNVKKIFKIPVEIIMLKDLLPEYGGPTNVACYGVLTYAVNNRPDPQAIINNSSWRSLLSKFKKCINS